jgi:hypothetical protein
MRPIGLGRKNSLFSGSEGGAESWAILASVRKTFDAYEKSADARQFRDIVGPLLGSPYDDRLYVPIN